jgi:hypothetical protein
MTDNQDSLQDKPCKAFRLTAGQIRDLARGHGGCMASDRITVDGAKVGFCYREASDFVADSGWRFFAGDESQAYTDCAENFAFYDINTMANYDRDIIALLGAPRGTAFERDSGGAFVVIQGWEPEDD